MRGSFWWRRLGRDAGAGRRRASIDRHAFDRHGAGRARLLRARLRRRTRDHARLSPSTTSSATARKTQSKAGCATRRAARSICGCRHGRWNSPNARSMRALARDIIDGGYWLRPPGPNCEIVIAYQGVVAPEAIAAAGFLAEDRRDVAVLAVTSADRLNAGWQAASRARMRGLRTPLACRALAVGTSRFCALRHRDRRASGDPVLARRRAGHRMTSLGVEHFGQVGPHRRSLCASRHRHDGDPRSRAGAGGGKPVRYLRAI